MPARYRHRTAGRGRNMFLDILYCVCNSFMEGKEMTDENIPEALCSICGKNISWTTGEYAQIKDFKDGKFTGDGFVHGACWDSKFSVIKELELKKLVKQQKMIAGLLSKIFGGAI